MTTPALEKTPAEIAECCSLFDLESNLGLRYSVVLAEKAATLARYAIGGLMRQAGHSVINEADLTLIEDIIYAAENHAGMARKRLDDAAPTAAVHPPLGEPVTHGTRGPACPVCGGATLGNGEDLGCARCDARMHSECYWGRVVTLAEWQAFVRHINGGPDEYEGPPTVCAQCRAKGEGA